MTAQEFFSILLGRTGSAGEDRKRELAKRRKATLEQLETLGTACWMLMDLVWMSGWTGVALGAGSLAILAQLAVFRFIPRTVADWAVNGAVLCWLLMNFSWLLSDYQGHWVVRIGQIIGVIGFILLGVSIWTGGLAGPALQRFRRLKLWGLGSRD
jgi:hypothetical protein